MIRIISHEYRLANTARFTFAFGNLLLIERVNIKDVDRYPHLE